jgi:biotin-dependent carboxylase-like uncharacterized protein
VALRVIHPGAGATVQDLGRPGYRAWGVPLSGAFDRGSFELANALLGNPPEAAAVELTLVGGEYQAEIPLAIALAGAPMAAAVVKGDGPRVSLQVPQTWTLQPGDRLILGGAPRGARTYLAVRGGWRTPVRLGSRSCERRLQAGDRLPAVPSATPTRRVLTPPLPLPDVEPIRILDGPDVGQLLDPAVWERATFRVGQESGRMGLRLEGPTPALRPEPERVSTPVAPGALQVTGPQLLVLGVACGTMGGYPHVGHVITADLDRLAQARPGTSLRFRRVSLEEARRLDRADRQAKADHRLRIAALAADRAGD